MRLLGGLALLDRLREGAVNIGAQQRLQGRGVACGERIHDDLERAARALEEAVLVETAIGGLDPGEPGGSRHMSRPGDRCRRAFDHGPAALAGVLGMGALAAAAPSAGAKGIVVASSPAPPEYPAQPEIRGTAPRWQR